MSKQSRDNNLPIDLETQNTVLPQSLDVAHERIKHLEAQLRMQNQQPKKPKSPQKPSGFLELLAHLWQFRFFIASWVYRDLISRSVRSQHGLFWMIFTPLAMTGIYVVAFSAIMIGQVRGSTDPLTFPFYMTIGITAWGLFSDLVIRLMGTFTSNAGFMQKIAFPKIILPVGIVISASITSIISTLIILAIFSFFGKLPTLHVLWFPLVLCCLASVAIGIGIILAVFTVFFRDLAHIIPIALQVLFWVTPIVYPIDTLKEPIKTYIAANPLTGIIESYRDIFVFHQNPNFLVLLQVFGIGLAFQAIAYFLFTKAQKELVDVL